MVSYLASGQANTVDGRLPGKENTQYEDYVFAMPDKSSLGTIICLKVLLWKEL